MPAAAVGLGRVRSTLLMTAGSSRRREERRLPAGEAGDRSRLPGRAGRPSAAVVVGRGARAAPATRRRRGRSGRRCSLLAVAQRRRRRRAVGGVGSTRPRRRSGGEREHAGAVVAARRARTARLTAWRCPLASRRYAADAAPVGTLLSPRAARMRHRASSRSAGGRRGRAAQHRRRRPAPGGRRAAGRRGACTSRSSTAAASRARRRGRWPPGPGRPAPTPPGRTPPGCGARPRRRARRRCGGRRCVFSSANQPPARRRQVVLVGRPLAVQRRRQLGRVAPATTPASRVVSCGGLRRQRRGGRPVGPQRAVHRDRPRLPRAAAASVRVRGGGEDPAPAERRRGVLGPVQALGHRLDVVGDRGRELPEVVHRQLDRSSTRRDVPRRRRPASPIGSRPRPRCTPWSNAGTTAAR